jgi:hypothetical protein
MTAAVTRATPPTHLHERRKFRLASPGRRGLDSAAMLLHVNGAALVLVLDHVTQSENNQERAGWYHKGQS